MPNGKQVLASKRTNLKFERDRRGQSDPQRAPLTDAEILGMANPAIAQRQIAERMRLAQEIAGPAMPVVPAPAFNVRRALRYIGNHPLLLFPVVALVAATLPSAEAAPQLRGESAGAVVEPNQGLMQASAPAVVSAGIAANLTSTANQTAAQPALAPEEKIVEKPAPKKQIRAQEYFTKKRAERAEKRREAEQARGPLQPAIAKGKIATQELSDDPCPPDLCPTIPVANFAGPVDFNPLDAQDYTVFLNGFNKWVYNNGIDPTPFTGCIYGSTDVVGSSVNNANTTGSQIVSWENFPQLVIQNPKSWFWQDCPDKYTMTVNTSSGTMPSAAVAEVQNGFDIINQNCGKIPDKPTKSTIESYIVPIVVPFFVPTLALAACIYYNRKRVQKQEKETTKDVTKQDGSAPLIPAEMPSEVCSVNKQKEGGLDSAASSLPAQSPLVTSSTALMANHERKDGSYNSTSTNAMSWPVLDAGTRTSPNTSVANSPKISAAVSGSSEVKEKPQSAQTISERGSLKNPSAGTSDGKPGSHVGRIKPKATESARPSPLNSAAANAMVSPVADAGGGRSR